MTSIPQSPRNTSNLGPEMHLLGMLSDRDSYIPNMEAQGQRELLASTTLPSEILHSTQADFEALGFVFREVVKGDPLFREVTLPEGWVREGSDHAMWSYLCDERGLRRVAVFYKAAFYDRKAHMSLQNVGYSASTDVLYGDSTVALPPKWDVFTEGERAAFVSGIDAMTRDIAEFPNIYCKYQPRVDAIKALLSTAV